MDTPDPAWQPLALVQVDYRNPQHVTLAGRDRVVALLQKHDAFAIGKTWLALLAGTMWCAGVTLFIAAVIAAIFVRFEIAVSFIAVWGIVALVVLPLSFWHERQTAGRFFEEGAAGLTRGRPGSYGEWEMRNTEAAWLAYAELALSGPRWFMQGLGLRNQRTGVDGPVLQRAATLLIQLNDLGEGTQLGTLTLPGEQPTTFRRAVTYLADHDWIGRSKDGGRIWLTTIAAQRLAGIGRTVTVR